MQSHRQRLPRPPSLRRKPRLSTRPVALLYQQIPSSLHASLLAPLRPPSLVGPVAARARGRTTVPAPTAPPASGAGTCLQTKPPRRAFLGRSSSSTRSAASRRSCCLCLRIRLWQRLPRRRRRLPDPWSRHLPPAPRVLPPSPSTPCASCSCFKRRRSSGRLAAHPRCARAPAALRGRIRTTARASATCSTPTQSRQRRRPGARRRRRLCRLTRSLLPPAHRRRRQSSIETRWQQPLLRRLPPCIPIRCLRLRRRLLGPF